MSIDFFDSCDKEALDKYLKSLARKSVKCEKRNYGLREINEKLTADLERLEVDNDEMTERAMELYDRAKLLYDKSDELYDIAFVASSVVNEMANQKDSDGLDDENHVDVFELKDLNPGGLDPEDLDPSLLVSAYDSDIDEGIFSLSNRVKEYVPDFDEIGDKVKVYAADFDKIGNKVKECVPDLDEVGDKLKGYVSELDGLGDKVKVPLLNVKNKLKGYFS